MTKLLLLGSAQALSLCCLPQSSGSVFAAARCSSIRQLPRRAVLAAASGQEQRRQAPSDALPTSHTLLLATALSIAGIALPAGAEEVAQEAVAAFGTEPASEALATAQAAAESAPTDLVFTALFSIAIGALAVVTLGVAYLSFTSWNDGRLEEEDRRRAESFRPASDAITSKKAEAKKAAVSEKAADEFKGFGKK